MSQLTYFEIYQVENPKNGKPGTIIVKDVEELRELIEPGCFVRLIGSINSVMLAESYGRISKSEEYKQDLRDF